MSSSEERPPAGNSPAQPKDLERLLRIELPVIAVLAEKRIKLGDVLRLDVGSVIEFEKPARDPLDLMVNDRRVGRGQAVRAGENFGLRVTEIAGPRETIRKLGREEGPA